MASILPRGAARVLAAAAASLLLLLAPHGAAAAAGTRDADVPSYEQRASAEKSSRTRYRRLEIASAILIIAVGAVVGYWAARRK